MDDSGRDVHVAALEHDGILNATKFSKLAPHHLLTTTQSSKCNVFDVKNLNDSGPMISLSHPHRPFQHLTPIVANWHPVVPSTFVIGRYPEQVSDRRTIDVYQMNGSNIRCVARLEDPRVSGIQCVCFLDSSQRLVNLIRLGRYYLHALDSQHSCGIL